MISPVFRVDSVKFKMWFSLVVVISWAVQTVFFSFDTLSLLVFFLLGCTNIPTVPSHSWFHLMRICFVQSNAHESSGFVQLWNLLIKWGQSFNSCVNKPLTLQRLWSQYFIYPKYINISLSFIFILFKNSRRSLQKKEFFSCRKKINASWNANSSKKKKFWSNSILCTFWKLICSEKEKFSSQRYFLERKIEEKAPKIA